MQNMKIQNVNINALYAKVLFQTIACFFLFVALLFLQLDFKKLISFNQK